MKVHKMPFPEQYLPPDLRMILNELFIKTRSPPEMLYANVLVALATAAQPHFKVERKEGLGELWQDVTDNKGIYYNCNRNKENYARSGLGLIDHTDTEKRESLNLAVDYLCKSEQSIDPLKETGKERSFTRGVAPRPKSNAGRPRHEIEGEAPETDEN